MSQISPRGLVPALIIEYAKAVEAFKVMLLEVGDQEFEEIVDPDARNDDFRSVRSITNHVIRAGYVYANYIRRQYAQDLVEHSEEYDLQDAEAACDEFDAMLDYTVASLDDKLHFRYRDVIQKNIIETGWRQSFDLEQMLEHAIVHVLRHKGQIEAITNEQ